MPTVTFEANDISMDNTIKIHTIEIDGVIGQYGYCRSRRMWFADAGDEINSSDIQEFKTRQECTEWIGEYAETYGDSAEIDS